ncbi:MAG: hypothetical protein ABI960_00905, partial [Candidatus Eisenbacteria bacterium]
MATPERRLAGFVAAYDPAIAARARMARRKMRALLPGATELVYDNYNALVIGFGPGERTSEAAISIALYPRWVTLFFLDGVGLADPRGLLLGSGKRVRRLLIEGPETLESPAVRGLIAQAWKRAGGPATKAGPHRRSWR